MSLPCNGNDCHVLMLLPGRNGGVRRVVGKLSRRGLGRVSRGVRGYVIGLGLPGFAVRRRLPLGTVVDSLNTPSVFITNGTGFDRFTSNGFFMDGVLRGTGVRIGRRKAGTTTMATTIVLATVTPRRAEGIRFVTSHPFICVVRSDRDNNVLFVKRCYKARWFGGGRVGVP